jgi:erythromycin esterase
MTPGDDADDPLARLRADAVTADALDPAAVGRALGRVEALTDAAVVGLGEATHRTAEFVRLKRATLRHLAAQRELRLLALEAPFAETLALDRYVRGTAATPETPEPDDLDAVLDRIGFSIYQTEEFVALVEQLRRHNADRPAADRVAVHGIDVQSVAGTAERLRTALADCADAPPVDTRLRTAAEGVLQGTTAALDRLRAAEAAATALRSWVEDRSRDGPTVSPRLRQLVRTLEQACAFARAGETADRPTQWGLRDRYMAENVARLHALTGPGTTAVWAHDNHVQRGRLSGAGAPSAAMGAHLRRRFGEDYYALGLQFCRGRVRALVPVPEGPVDVTIDGTDYRRQVVETPAPAEGSVPAAFDALVHPLALLDLRSVPADGPLSAWLREPRSHRYVTGTVDPTEPSSFGREHVPWEAFDGLAVVARGTPTTPLEESSA